MIIDSPDDIPPEVPPKDYPWLLQLTRHVESQPPAYSYPTPRGEGRLAGGHAPNIPPSDPINQVSIQTRQDNISGTYRIDPDLASRGSGSDTLRKLKKTRSKINVIPSPNASFRSGHGHCMLNLATSGSNLDTAKVNIRVGTRTGHIFINLFALHEQKRINLDIITKKGNITLLIPRDFRGAVQLRARRDALTFLPAFESVMRILNKIDDETLILIGDTVNFTAGSSGTNILDDFCQVTSQSGKIIVGLSGEDIAVPEGGIWKKVGEYFRGKT